MDIVDIGIGWQDTCVYMYMYMYMHYGMAMSPELTDF